MGQDNPTMHAGHRTRKRHHGVLTGAALAMGMALASWTTGCGSTPPTSGQASPAPQSSVVASAPAPASSSEASSQPSPAPVLATPAPATTTGVPASPAATVPVTAPASPAAAPSPAAATSPQPSSAPVARPSGKPVATAPSPTPVSPASDLPIYPYAQKKAATRGKETAGTGTVFQHDILVLRSTDRIDKVKDFYKARIKPNIVMDTKNPNRVITMNLAPAGQVTESFVSAVVLQEEAGGGTQITLSTYKPLP